MSKTVAVTGCFGHVGYYVVEKLLEDGHKVIGLDILEPKNHHFKNSANFLSYKLDLANKSSIDNTVDRMSKDHDVDVLIHIAFIIPPGTSKNLELSTRINVDGSRNLFDKFKSTYTSIHIIFTSSISTLKPREIDAEPVPHPPVSTDIATTQYGQHKIIVENYLIENHTETSWSICKLASVLTPEKYLTIDEDNANYSRQKLPYDTKAQSVHVRNVAIAYANIVKEPSRFDKKIYLLSGSVEDRMYFYDFIGHIMKKLTGLPMEITKEVLPTIYTMTDRYYMHWYDNEETEKELNYLQYDFDDFLIELDQKAGMIIKISRSLNSIFFKISKRYAKWFARLVLK